MPLSLIFVLGSSHVIIGQKQDAKARYACAERPLCTSNAMTIRGHNATKAQIAIMTSVVEKRRIGDFTASRDYLSYCRVTNNGWAAASIIKRDSSKEKTERPGGSNNKTVIFRLAHDQWNVFSYGSSALKGAAFRRVGIPTAVLRALDILDKEDS